MHYVRSLWGDRRRLKLEPEVSRDGPGSFSSRELPFERTLFPALSPLRYGQVKRVNIGIALVANPAVLFLDEPVRPPRNARSLSIFFF